MCICQFWEFGLLAFSWHCPKFTSRCLFYCTLSISVCGFQLQYISLKAIFSCFVLFLMYWAKNHFISQIYSYFLWSYTLLGHLDIITGKKAKNTDEKDFSHFKVMRFEKTRVLQTQVLWSHFVMWNADKKKRITTK